MDLGQVFTRQNVAEYMVSLLELDKGASILDPCFGSGAFLKACTNQGYNNISGYELDETLFKEVQASMPALKLFNQDFLGACTEIEYDGIIMNPPYIRQEKIDDLQCFGITKDILRHNRIFDNLPRTANMYMYFILKAIDMLKINGQLVVIFPSSWLQARSGKSFEKLLNSQCTLKKQIYISGEIFEKDALVEVVILSLIKGKILTNSKTKKMEIVNSRFIDKEFSAIEDNLLFSVGFSTYAKVRRGLTTGFNSMFINPKLNDKSSQKVLVPIISSPKSINGYNTKGAETDMLLALSKDNIVNDEIYTYLSFWEKKIIQAASPKTLYDKIQKDKFWYTTKLIGSQGILFSYFVRNDMKFIDNKLGTLARDNFYIIYPKIDKNLLFALLNNYYTYYQLEKTGKRYGAGLLKLQRYDIENLKFPDVDAISIQDCEKLCQLSERLSLNGDSCFIREITEIIATYSNVGFSEIINQYIKIKQHRLEG